MSEFDHRNFYRSLSGSEKGLRKSSLNGDSNPDLCDAGEVLCTVQPSAQLGASRYVSQLNNHNTGIFRVFEMWIGMSEFDV